MPQSSRRWESTGKLNILFVGPNNDKVMGATKNQYEFKKAIGKYAKCKYVGKGHPDYIAGETTDESVNHVMPDADWVIDDNINYYVKDKKARDYKLGLFISDLHAKHDQGIRNPVEWANLLNRAGYDGVFMRYPLVHGTGYRPEIFYEVLGERAHWVPWSVNTEKFYPRDEKRYDVALLGAKEDCYPLRKKMFEGIYFVARGHRILCRECPPDIDRRTKFSDDEIVGDRYAEALGRSRILIFDCSTYRYPILKFFEGMASGCLVMSDAPTMGKRLGFIHRITYSEIDEVTWEEGLKFFLEHPKEARKIARPGTDMCRKYHSHETRAEQFCQLLKTLE